MASAAGLSMRIYLFSSEQNLIAPPVPTFKLSLDAVQDVAVKKMSCKTTSKHSQNSTKAAMISVGVKDATESNFLYYHLEQKMLGHQDTGIMSYKCSIYTLAKCDLRS